MSNNELGTGTDDDDDDREMDHQLCDYVKQEFDQQDTHPLDLSHVSNSPGSEAAGLFRTDYHHPMGESDVLHQISRTDTENPIFHGRIKSEATNVDQFEPSMSSCSYTIPRDIAACIPQDTGEWEGLGDAARERVVPLNIIQAPGNGGLLKIDVDDPLHPPSCRDLLGEEDTGANLVKANDVSLNLYC
jgi:hypothetical protein